MIEMRPTSRGSPQKAIFKYPGAKWRLAKKIVSLFPPHHSYLEPFFGSGAVLFTKERSHIETVNDLDGDIVNLFSWIQHDPEKLAHAIHWTPYSREVYEKAHAAQYTETDSFQRAVDFYIRMMMGHGFRTTGERVGWKNDIQGRARGYAAQDWVETPERIMDAAERLRSVQIECRPAVEVIRRMHSDKVLIYADPPYVLSTLRQKQYKHTMTDDDHLELLEALMAHPGPVLLSGYDHPLYDDMLQSWHKEIFREHTQAASSREEVLWMNFTPQSEAQLKME